MVGLEYSVLHRLRHEIRTDEYVADSYDTDPAAVQQAIAHILVEQAERAALERERAKKAAERAEMLARPAACCVCGANEADGAEFSNSQKVRFKLAKCKQCIEGAQEQQKAAKEKAEEALAEEMAAAQAAAARTAESAGALDATMSDVTDADDGAAGATSTDAFMPDAAGASTTPTTTIKRPMPIGPASPVRRQSARHAERRSSC
uniref:Stc1 domain-containing protein n=1 Tax=Prymnesium polylepis TaxID=72548 RepID=A0A7S4M3Q4_9EUKA